MLNEIGRRDRRARLSAPGTLAAFGLGPVDPTAVPLAAAMGAVVIGIGIDPARVEIAKAFGAEHGIDGQNRDPVEEVRKDQLEGKIQERYGVTWDEARRQVDAWLNRV